MLWPPWAESGYDRWTKRRIYPNHHGTRPSKKGYFQDHLIPDLAVADELIFPAAVAMVRGYRKIRPGWQQVEELRDDRIEVTD